MFPLKAEHSIVSLHLDQLRVSVLSSIAGRGFSDEVWDVLFYSYVSIILQQNCYFFKGHEVWRHATQKKKMIKDTNENYSMGSASGGKDPTKRLPFQISVNLYTYHVVQVVVNCIIFLTFTIKDRHRVQCITLYAFFKDVHYFRGVTNWYASSQLHKLGCAVTADVLMFWTIRNSSAKRGILQQGEAKVSRYQPNSPLRRILPRSHQLFSCSKKNLSYVLEMLILSHKRR